jgi:peptidoglycan/LPS O-acetylase OafA/YrhL
VRKSLSQSKFREDINALRAVAVISVVLYHLDFNVISAGFAGVDIFFVISGYLMTLIIFKKLQNDTFTFKSFYVSRFNRIVPPLAVLCFFLLIYGWYHLYDSAYTSLIDHIRSSIFFVSNYFYWKEASYFDSGKENILLHTWSLSVEWQFYLLFPILVYTSYNIFNLKFTKFLIVLLLLIGFLISIVFSSIWPNASYFLFPTRAWEMLFGSVAFLFPNVFSIFNKRLLEVLGVTLIISSIFLFSENTLWPGYSAFVPVFGTYLVIVANVENSYITSNFVVRYIGKSSYSIYLWHWPIYLIAVDLCGDDSYVKFVSLVFTFIFGIISFEYIEKRINGYQSFVIYIFLALLVIVFSFSNLINQRALSNAPENIIANLLLTKYSNYTMDPQNFFYDCNAAFQYEQKGELTVESRCISAKSGGVLFWGDSHLASIATGIRSKFPKLSYSQLTSASCPPSFTFFKVGPSALGCNFSNKYIRQMISLSNPKVVILGTRDNHESYDWSNTVSTLKSLGVSKVIIIGPLPQWLPSLPKIYVKRHLGQLSIEDESFVNSLVKSNDYMIKLNNNNNNFTYINILSELCSNLHETPRCLVRVDDDLLSFDYGHLTVEGSKYISKNFIKNFTKQ